MKNTDEVAKKLINYAKQQGIFLVIRFQDFKSRRLNVKNGLVDESAFIEIKGTGIQAFTKSGHMGFASVDTISNEKRLIQCLKSAIQAAKTAKEQKFESIKEIFALKKTRAKDIQSASNDPFKILKNRLQKNLISFNKELIRKNPNCSISSTASFSKDHWRILRSDGTCTEFKIPASILSSLVTLKIGNYSNSVFIATNSKGYEILSSKQKLLKHKEKLDSQLKYIKKSKGAKTLEGGHFTVLLDGEIAGVFAHEAFGHTAESDHVYQKSPLLEGGKVKKGMQVAKSFVNIFDETSKDELGYQPYSSYGVKRQKASIVKKGKIDNLINDVITAKKTQSKLMGGSRSDFYSNIPFPRMSSIEIQIDKSHLIPISYNHQIADIERIHQTLKVNKIFNDHKEVIFLKGFAGGNVDSYNGNFQFGSTVAFKLTQEGIILLKPLSFSGITLKALESIELGLGDSVASPGSCGKWGQYVPETSKAPMLLFGPSKYLTVG